MSAQFKPTRKPTPSQVIKKQVYWAMLDQTYGHIVINQTIQFPAWVFDFISVSLNFDDTYGLCSPMCLIEDKENGTYKPRPTWEKETFKTKTAAINRAKQLAKLHRLFTVDCVKPTYL